jgi:hypothetical protein
MKGASESTRPENREAFLTRKAHIYPGPQHVVLTRMRRAGKRERNPARLARTIQDPASELPRILIPRTWVNRGRTVEEGYGAAFCGDCTGGRIRPVR